MAKKKSVGINFIMNFILTISNFIFPLITFPYVSRILGAEGIGVVTFAGSIVTYFSMVGMLGIPTYGIRACAKVRDDKEKLSKTVYEILWINVIFMLVALVALLVSVMTIERLAAEKPLYLLLSTSLIFNVLGVDWLYRSLEEYSYITIRSLVMKFISVILLFVFVQSSQDYLAYAAITILAGVGSNLMNFLYLRKLVSIRFYSWGDLSLRPHLKPILVFFLLTVSTVVYLNVDTTLLGFLKGDEAVGYYSAATKIKQILVSIVTSLGAVLLPRLSYYVETKKHEEFNNLVRKALNFVFLAATPLSVYFILFARESIVFLSGDGFLSSVLPMQILMPTVLFIGISNLTGIQILVPTHREKLVVYSTMLGALVDLIINLFFMPHFGVEATAVASTFAEATVLLVQVFFLKELIFPMMRTISFWKMGLSILLASFIVIFASNYLVLPLFFELVVTAVLFFAVYGLTLLITKEEFILGNVQHLVKKLK